MMVSVPTEWSRTDRRTYRHEKLDVELSVEPGDDGFDVAFDHDDGRVRLGGVRADDPEALARGMMETFDERYPHSLTPGDADRDSVRVAVRGTVAHHRR